MKHHIWRGYFHFNSIGYKKLTDSALYIMIYQGQCHCADIRFEVEAPQKIKCVNCNCSICSKSWYLHLIVPRSKFHLIEGATSIKTYTFGSGIAKHHFCNTCGVKSFYIPRSNPDGVDVNVNCLQPRPVEIEIESFDGQQWDNHAHTLKHLSEEK